MANVLAKCCDKEYVYICKLYMKKSYSSYSTYLHRSLQPDCFHLLCMSVEVYWKEKNIVEEQNAFPCVRIRPLLLWKDKSGNLVSWGGGNSRELSFSASHRPLIQNSSLIHRDQKSHGTCAVIYWPEICLGN